MWNVKLPVHAVKPACLTSKQRKFLVTVTSFTDNDLEEITVTLGHTTPVSDDNKLEYVDGVGEYTNYALVASIPGISASKTNTTLLSECAINIEVGGDRTIDACS